VGINISGVTKEMVTQLAPAIASIKHVRQFGAVALELCLLARGMLDAYIDFRDKVRPTDLAAGYLIAKEAGARFYSKDGSELDCELTVDKRLSFFASSPSAYRQLSSVVLSKRTMV
jgi:myo-inositol-1(or 4)-monophosphatase